MQSLSDKNSLKIELWRKKWPAGFIVVIFWLAFSILLVVSLHSTQGRFIYPLDDTYIHMAIAKNFSQNGIWGISRQGFSSLSSSPLWTLLLSSLYAVFGPSPLIPLILTSLLGAFLLLVLAKWLADFGLPPPLNFSALVAIVFFTPLLPLVFSGLEHILHALFILLLVGAASKSLSAHSGPSFWKWLWLAPAAILTRYESFFIIAAIVFLLALKKKWVQSSILVMAGTFPVVLYGIISLKKGWFFLPNSVYLKGRSPDLASIGGLFNWFLEPWKISLENVHIFLVLILSLAILLILYLKKKTPWTFIIAADIIFIMALLLHIQFAKTGWFYRYEAYLMMLGLFIIALAAYELRSAEGKTLIPGAERNRNTARIFELVFVLGLAGAALGVRGANALVTTPLASKNIHEQQYQMGLFLRTYYNNKNIAANDIGAINYLSDIRCLDLWGLSDMDVARAKKRKSYDVNFIDQLTKTHQIKIAILYDDWFAPYGGLPPTWIKVAEWTIQNNRICSRDTVAFYAVDVSEEERLIRNLKEFSTNLPHDVIRKIGPDFFQ